VHLVCLGDVRQLAICHVGPRERSGEIIEVPVIAAGK
jgi:hypothetical protein